MNEMEFGISQEELDGFFILYQAVKSRLDMELMPGQLMRLSHADGQGGKAAFVHSVGQSTKLSTTTFVLQKRFRRAFLQKNKVPIPTGATFAYFSKRDPVRYAKKIGYPVVIKEVFGENPSYSVFGVGNRKNLLSAASKVRGNLPTSPGATPSSYAQTINLSTAENNKEGKRVKSGKARFLLEKQIDGELYKTYVIGGAVKFALKETNGRYQKVPVAPSVQRIAEKTIRLISGISNAVVDVVVDGEGKHYVVEISERLRIPENSDEAFALNSAVADMLIDAELGGERKKRKRDDRDKLQVDFNGVSKPEAFMENLENAFADGAGYSINEADEISGFVRITVFGNSLSIAKFLCNIFHNEHVAFIKIENLKSRFRLQFPKGVLSSGRKGQYLPV